jgi:hypothetical protein
MYEAKKHGRNRVVSAGAANAVDSTRDGARTGGAKGGRAKRGAAETGAAARRRPRH